MTTTIEARRLNGTDLGKTLGSFGVLQVVSHCPMTVQLRGARQPLTFKVVQIETNAGQFALLPSAKILITGAVSSEAKS